MRKLENSNGHFVTQEAANRVVLMGVLNADIGDKRKENQASFYLMKFFRQSWSCGWEMKICLISAFKKFFNHRIENY